MKRTYNLSEADIKDAIKTHLRSGGHVSEDEMVHVCIHYSDAGNSGDPRERSYAYAEASVKPKEKG